MAMCAIHKMKMSTYVYHYMMHISLHAVMVIIIILVITFMHGIYNYVTETNRFSRLYSVAAVLYLQFVLHVMLFRT